MIVSGHVCRTHGTSRACVVVLEPKRIRVVFFSLILFDHSFARLAPGSGDRSVGRDDVSPFLIGSKRERRDDALKQEWFDFTI